MVNCVTESAKHKTRAAQFLSTRGLDLVTTNLGYWFKIHRSDYFWDVISPTLSHEGIKAVKLGWYSIPQKQNMGKKTKNTNQQDHLEYNTTSSTNKHRC